MSSSHSTISENFLNVQGLDHLQGHSHDFPTYLLHVFHVFPHFPPFPPSFPVSSFFSGKLSGVSTLGLSGYFLALEIEGCRLQVVRALC